VPACRLSWWCGFDSRHPLSDWFIKAVRVVRRAHTRIGPDDKRRGQRRTSLVPVRVRRKECPVRVASHAGIELVRIGETEPQLLTVRLRLTTGAVRRIQAKGVVIQARERAPRHTLILVRPHAASSYLTRESAVRAQSHNCRTDRSRQQSLLAHHPPPLYAYRCRAGNLHNLAALGQDSYQRPGLAPSTSGSLVYALVASGCWYRRRTTPLPKVRVSARWSAILVSDAANRGLPRPMTTGWT
jgi:hypothetical protein